MTTFKPQPSSTVLAILPQGGGWLLGGNFVQIGGRSIAYLARIGAGGQVDPTFTPGPDGPVHAMLPLGGETYLGGEFSGFTGGSRVVPAPYLARLRNNAPDPAWQPRPNQAVLALAADGRYLFAGGRFTSMARLRRQYLARLPLGGAGTPTLWNPAPDNEVHALRVDGGWLYVGGAFYAVASHEWPKLARFDLASLALDTRFLSTGENGSVYAIEPQAGGGLLVGGSFNGWDNDFAKRSLVSIAPGALPAPASVPAPASLVTSGDAPEVLADYFAPSVSSPPNDDFAAATVQTGDFWLTQGTLYGATSEPNEPLLTGAPNGPTAWWRWTAPVSAAYRVRTWGSEDATLLAVYRGATLDATRLVDFGTGHNSVANSAEVVFAATADKTYSIQVLGADYASSTAIYDAFLPSRLQLSLTRSMDQAPAPPHDAFADAQALTGATADVVVNNAGATPEPGEPLDLPDARANTVWLAWTAPSNGVWQLDARQGDFDSLVAVYTGTTVNTLARLDFGDDSDTPRGTPYARGGRVTLRAAAGQTYHIQVQGASLVGTPTDFGNARLLLQPVEPPANDDFAAAKAIAGDAPSADAWTTFATREPGEPAGKPDESESVWWRYTARRTGLLAVIQSAGTVAAYTGTALTNLARLPYTPNAGTRPSLGGVTDWYAVVAGTTVYLRGTAFGERVVFSLRTVQPPANDDFAARKTLTGATTGDTVDLEYASHEYGEPNTDAAGPQTVWYEWTAPAAGRYLLATAGSPSFTRVRVYTGTELTALTPAGVERLYGYAPAAHGRVLLDTSAGRTYAIRLDRESIVTGLDRPGQSPCQSSAKRQFRGGHRDERRRLEHDRRKHRRHLRRLRRTERHLQRRLLRGPACGGAGPRRPAGSFASARPAAPSIRCWRSTPARPSTPSPGWGRIRTPAGTARAR